MSHLVSQHTTIPLSQLESTQPHSVTTLRVVESVTVSLESTVCHELEKQYLTSLQPEQYETVREHAATQIKTI